MNLKKLFPVGKVVTKVRKTRGHPYANVDLCTHTSGCGMAVTLSIPPKQASRFEKGMAVIAYFPPGPRYSALPLQAVELPDGSVVKQYEGFIEEEE